MKVGLYDIDSRIPNLALAKLAAHHRRAGDDVSLFDPLWEYDKVYASKVFGFTEAPYLSESMEFGGTGSGKDATLPEEVEDLCPGPEDYALWSYPHSLGFTQRGCRFACKFCVVPKKEGRPRGAHTVEEIWTNRASRFVVLLDNDFFGGPEWRERIEEVRRLDLLVSFCQGLNIRLITDEQARALASVKFRNLSGKCKQVHFAWDRIRDGKLINAGIDRCVAAGIAPRQMAFYVLIGFDSTPAEDMHRVRLLADRGCDPFVMAYDRRDPYQRAFQRWVNHRAVFKTVAWDDYRWAGSKPVKADGRQLPMFEAHV